MSSSRLLRTALILVPLKAERTPKFLNRSARCMLLDRDSRSSIARDHLARVEARYLIKKFSFFSLVPFISSRIQIGVMPRPVHFSFGSFFDWYFGCGFARLPVRGLATRAPVDPAVRLPFVFV